jgi:hypothetical protein
LTFQKLTFARILDHFSNKADELRRAFNGFDESVIRAGQRAKVRQEFTFEQYATAVGFPTPIQS